MPVYKLCLKLIRDNRGVMLLYIGIFLLISVLITIDSNSSQVNTFKQQKADIALISQDSTPLTAGFRKELSKSCRIVPIPDQQEKLQDALFFRQVTYVLRIPKGFTQSALSGGSMKMEKMIIPNSVPNAYVDRVVQQYWHLARLHAEYQPGINQKQLVRELNADLAGKTPVSIQAQQRAVTSGSFSATFFNFLAYTLASVLIFGISSVMIIFNDKNLNRRMICAPLSAARANFQLMLGLLTFTAAAWVFFVAFCFAFDPKSVGTLNMVYFLLNSLVLTFCMASMSYLIGNLLQDRNAVSAVCNVITLGPCFISGVFVPPDMLSTTVLKIASFTPTYWYVQANERIAGLTRFDWPNLQPVFYNMLVLIGFALAFFCLALVAGKRKRLSGG